MAPNESEHQLQAIPLYRVNAPGVINGKIYVSGGQLLGEKPYAGGLRSGYRHGPLPKRLHKT
jgi:hypothetical protein